ncbi:MAG: hypothetical protein CVV07_06905 [Gammaproteobacteria bacterium HGW-Gammaproteobacteria-11]|nr:MAG: hypothetical protein CVV07_06905 [Gammaproteobacteria bacterium HGW-Gammaproteobacteria-11]
MKTRWIAVGLFVFSSTAFGWQDVSKSAIVPAGGVYCTSIGNLDDFGGYALDGDQRGATRMVNEGKCAIASRNIRVSVFQENADYANFIAPSGNAFYTLKGYLQY